MCLSLELLLWSLGYKIKNLGPDFSLNLVELASAVSVIIVQVV